MKLIKSAIIRRLVILSIVLFSTIIDLNAQSEQFRNLAQFLFPEFSKSIVKMKVGKDLTLMLNYNIVTEKMVFIQKDKVYDMLNPEAVDTAIISSRKFIPAGKAFYEVILEGPLNLYVQHKGNIVEPGKPAAYGGTSQVSSSTSLSRIDMGGGQVYNMKLPEDLIIKSAPVFLISINNNNFSFVNERQFLKLFPGKEKEIKSFIKKNRLKFENPMDMIRLVQYCSQSVK